MTIEEIKSELVSVVNANQGGKLFDLLQKMGSWAAFIDPNDILYAILQSVEAGDIRIVDYTIEGGSNIPRIILLPRCTNVTIT